MPCFWPLLTPSLSSQLPLHPPASFLHPSLSAPTPPPSQHSMPSFTVGSSTPSDSEQVLCPVCGRAALVQLHGVFACPLERWQLDVRVESLTLDSLRHRLAGVYEVR